MPTYKLIYFDGKARAEAIRYLFQLSGTEFEDCRVEYEKWPELKPKIGLGQLPVLEIDGTEYPQSHAAYRHLSRKFGFYGKDDHERFLIDIVCETADDLWAEIFRIFQAEKEKKPELRETFKTEGALKVTANLEKLLKKNKNGTGWFVGDGITLADVMAFNMIYDFIPFVLETKEGEFDLKDQEVLKAFVERFKSNAKISDWLKKRPQTPF
ncbi:S-crystallin SL11-like [Apostichopus japonicus]|uniref:S-crystallin SL11-like n=1 Tax=Stichopus japonicus TaxID=307972 RepID=UPI003AB53075